MNLENQFDPSLPYVKLFSVLFQCRILNRYSDSKNQAVAQEVTQQLQGTEFELHIIKSKLFSYNVLLLYILCCSRSSL